MKEKTNNIRTTTTTYGQYAKKTFKTTSTKLINIKEMIDQNGKNISQIYTNIFNKTQINQRIRRIQSNPNYNPPTVRIYNMSSTIIYQRTSNEI